MNTPQDETIALLKPPMGKSYQSMIRVVDFFIDEEHEQAEQQEEVLLEEAAATTPAGSGVSEDGEQGYDKDDKMKNKKQLCLLILLSGLALVCSFMTFFSGRGRVPRSTTTSSTSSSSTSSSSMFRDGGGLVENNMYAHGTRKKEALDSRTGAPALGQEAAVGPDDTSCVDDPNWRGWLGKGCDWYDVLETNRCEKYGSKESFNNGGTANNACCVCAAGRGGEEKEISVPNDVCPPGTKPFNMTLINTGMSTRYDALMLQAKARWEQIIKCDLEDVTDLNIKVGPSDTDRFAEVLSKPYSGPVDDMVIGYEFVLPKRSGPGILSTETSTLAFAGRTDWRETGSTISGYMKFDIEKINNQGYSDGT